MSDKVILVCIPCHDRDGAFVPEGKKGTERAHEHCRRKMNEAHVCQCVFCWPEESQL